MYDVRYTVLDVIKCTVYDVRYTILDVTAKMHKVRIMKYELRAPHDPMYDVRCTILDVKEMVEKIRYLQAD